MEDGICMGYFANFQEQRQQNLKNNCLYFMPLACLRSELKEGLWAG